MEKELKVTVNKNGDVYINNNFAAQLCFTPDAVGSAVAQYLAEEDTEGGPAPEERSEKIRRAVHETLRNSHWGVEEKDDGSFEYEIYPSCDDRLSDEDVADILEAGDPAFALDQKVEEKYWDHICSVWDSLAIEAAGSVFPKLSAEDEDDIIQSALEVVKEVMVIKYPYDHYISQTYRADITIDTGDMNYDFTLNSVYPGYYRGKEEVIEDRASLVWLAKTQGYTKPQLEAALAKGDVADPKSFLDSVRQEVANEATHMNMLTFLVKMKLSDMLRVNELMKKQKPDGEEIFEADLRPDCGTLRLGKDTMTGLFNSYDGAGSCFGIELEKDVEVPVKYIHSCQPDRYFHWCVKSVYDMPGSAWKDVLAEIKEPDAT